MTTPAPEKPFHHGYGVHIWLSNVCEYSAKVLELDYFRANVAPEDIAALEKAKEVAARILAEKFQPRAVNISRR